MRTHFVVFGAALVLSAGAAAHSTGSQQGDASDAGLAGRPRPS
jgi:hypothetical protein